MFRVNMDVTPPLKDLQRLVESIEQNVIEDLNPFWNIYAAPLVAEEITRIFATEGYGTWAPLSERYAVWKSKHYPGRTILRLKDNYFRASTIRGTEGNLFRSDKDSMVWGVDLSSFRMRFGFPYPIVHESGSASTNLPARQVYALAEKSKALQDKLVVSFKKWLQDRVNAETQKVFG